MRRQGRRAVEAAVLSALRRLRGRSSAELRERAAQSAAAWLERFTAEGSGEALDERALDRALVRALAPGAPSSPEQLLGAFRARVARGAFLQPFTDPEATVAALRQYLPNDEQDVLARAERIHGGRFQLLGYEDLDFGQPIDWHYDPVSGRRAPATHWSRIPYLDASVVGDHKVIWELNRMQYLVTLGQAYWYSGDERHAECFARHVTGWLADNPPKVGINWASSLEVSLRAMSWLWGLHFFARSPALTAPLHARMLAALDVHGRHVERYLSTYFSPNTHLTGEALGLVHMGMLLPDLRRAGRWRALGLRILEDEARRQVRPDGVYFEQATQYHRYTTEFYLHLFLLAERQGMTVAPHVRESCVALFRHLLHLTRGDGTIPLFGDDDGGRLVQLDGRGPEDVRGLLALGGAYLGDSELRFGARGDLAQVGWVLGADALARESVAESTTPCERSRAFPDGGYYVMREGWGAADAQLVVDCGPHGTMNGGHAHADALSLELWAQGRPLIVDPGTFSYSGAERDLFRSGAAHNALIFGGCSSSEPGATAFTWSTWADAAAERWGAGRAVDMFRGRVAGWCHPAPVVHWRQVLLAHGGYVLVHDRVRPATHDVELGFQLAAGLTLGTRRDHGVHICDTGAGHGERIGIVIFGEGELSVERGWVAPRYGSRVEAPRVRYRVPPREPANGVEDIVTFLLLPADGELPVVTRVPGAGGQAFRVSGTALDDVVLLRSGDEARVEASGVETDGSITWLRRRPDAPTLLAALDVTTVRVDGSTCMTAKHAVAFHEREC